MIEQAKPESFFMLTPEIRDRLLTAKLTAAEWRIWCYLVSLDPFGDRGAKYQPAELMLQCGVKKSTYFAAISKLAERGLIDLSFYGLKSNKNCTESQIRDRLKSQLGGLPEVKTPAGRIDLLTETEIIEVKRVGDWKSALGQLLVYSGFYPEHRKRLHLFGRESDEQKIATIANSCLSFDVTVSFEVAVEVES
ncbi:MAG: hypothetical protein WBC69_21745 [Geitlerinemataceae cyanobacterium]